MSSFTDIANKTISEASILEASTDLTRSTNLTRPTKRQLLLNQHTAFLNLQFFLCLLEYTNLRYYCQTCPLLFNKYNKYLNYRLNSHYSFLYYSNEAVRTTILARIPNPQKQLYINMRHYSYSDSIIDCSVLGNVYYLNLRNCYNIDITGLRYIRYLSLSGCKISDLSMLRDRDIDTLDLSYCNDVSDISPLNVRVLDLTSCYNIENFGTLDKVCVLNMTNCNCNSLDPNTYEIIMKIPIVLCVLCVSDGDNYYINNPEYREFRKKYFGMFY